LIHFYKRRRMVKITIKKSDIQSGSEEEEHDSSSAEEDGNSQPEDVDVETTSRLRKREGLREKEDRESRTSSKNSKSSSPIPQVNRFARKDLFTCELCLKAFHSRFVLKTHVKAHEKFESKKGKCDKYYLYYYFTAN